MRTAEGKKRAIKNLHLIMQKREGRSWNDHSTSFTCWEVRRAAGVRAKHAYEQAFGFDNYRPGNNSAKLWNMPDRKRNSMRILMLGFAAAMIQTGDL